MICESLEQLGYNVHAQVFNSKDFRVPQNQERIYIVAFRRDLDNSDFRFLEPTSSKTTIADILEKERVSAKYYLSTVSGNASLSSCAP